MKPLTLKESYWITEKHDQKRIWENRYRHKHRKRGSHPLRWYRKLLSKARRRALKNLDRDELSAIIIQSEIIHDYDI